VRSRLAKAGNLASLSRLMPALRAGGVRAVSANGVLGDPAGASAAEGERLLRQLAADLAAAVAAWYPDPDDGGRR
jgi:creatinine amidohydrolase